jgi:hypothetical protein
VNSLKIDTHSVTCRLSGGYCGGGHVVTTRTRRGFRILVRYHFQKRLQHLEDLEAGGISLRCIFTELGCALDGTCT